MSTTARKARKRAGIPFEREPKVGTPFTKRRHVAGASLVSAVQQVVRRDGVVAGAAYLKDARKRKFRGKV